MTHDTWVTFKTLVAKEFLLIRRNKWLTAGAWVSALCGEKASYVDGRKRR